MCTPSVHEADRWVRAKATTTEEITQEESLSTTNETTQTAKDEASTVAGAAKSEASNVAATAKDEAAYVAGTAKEEAASVAGTATAAAKDVASTATEQVSTVATEAKYRAIDLVGQTREQIRSQAGSQTKKLADTVRSLSSELRSMANRSEQQGTGAQLVRQVADRGQQLAGYLEASGPEQILDEIRNFARRKPGLFLAGAAAAGVVTGRLIRAATAGGPEEEQPSEYALTSYPAEPIGTAYPLPYETGTPVTTSQTYGAPTVEPTSRDYDVYPESTAADPTFSDPLAERNRGGLL